MKIGKQKWRLFVPIVTAANKVEWIWITADTGANLNGIQTQYALQWFKPFIRTTKNRTYEAHTPNGILVVKDVVFLQFPKNNRTIYIAPFFLMKDLPVNILCGINLIEEWGLDIPDGVPPAFRNAPREELDLELELGDVPKQFHYIPDALQTPIQLMLNCAQCDFNVIDYAVNGKIGFIEKAPQSGFNPSIIETVAVNNIQLANYNVSNYNTQLEAYNHSLNQIRRLLLLQKQNRAPLKLANFNWFHGKEDSETAQVNSAHFHFEASQQEILEATKVWQNKKALKFNDLSYIKKHDDGQTLYEGTIKLLQKWKHLFAANSYSSKPMNCAPYELGLKPECRDKIYNRKQFPLNHEKRVAYIAITMEKDQNGYFEPTKSPHNVRVMTILKSPDADGFRRIKDVQDWSDINKDCIAVEPNIPTLADAEQFNCEPGMWTILDDCNGFENMILAKADRPFAAVTTPIGRRQCTRAGYGSRNIAAAFQREQNKRNRAVGNALTYIDDTILKHNLETTTQEKLDHLEKFFIEKEKMGGLLNPWKFWAFISMLEFLGIQFTVKGHTISFVYKNKLFKLKLNRPTKPSEMATALGKCNYVAKYIKQYAFFEYHLRIIMKDNPLQNQKVLHWTPEATASWDALMDRIEKATFLFHHTRDGKYLVQADASLYAVGSILLQSQFDEDTNQMEWKVVDQHSKLVKEDMIPYHILTKELYALVTALKHYVWPLSKGHFTVHTDHRNIIAIFRNNEFKYDQQQIIRMKLFVAQFDFDLEYIKGDFLWGPDGLSRNEFDIHPVLKPYIPQNKRHIPLTDVQMKQLETTMNLLQRIRGGEINLAQFCQIDAISVESPTVDHSITNYQSLRSVKNDLGSLLYSKIINSRYREGDILEDSMPQNDRFIAYSLGIDDIFRSIIEDRGSNNPTIWLVNASRSDEIGQTMNSMNFEDMSTQSAVLCTKLMKSKRQDKAIKALLASIQIASNAGTKVQLMNMDQKLNFKAKIQAKTMDSGIIMALRACDKPLRAPTDANAPMISESTGLCNISETPVNPQTLENDGLCGAIETRAMRRQAEQVKRGEINEKAGYNEAERHEIDELDEFIEDHNDRQEMQHALFDDVFNYQRNKVDWMDNETFKQFQNEDSICQVLRFQISDESASLESQDMQDLKTFHPSLFTAAKKDRIVVDENGFVCIKCTNPINKKERLIRYVPDRLRGRIVAHAHHNAYRAHSGVKQTTRWIQMRYFWDRMCADIEKYVTTCELCQKAIGGMKSGIGRMAPTRASKPRIHIHCDHAGPFLKSLYILVIVCHYTGYVMLVPSFGTGAEETMDGILNHWMPIFGWYRYLSSDRGGAFIDEVNKRIENMMGVTQIFAEPRNHRSVGRVERAVRMVKDGLQVWNLESNHLITDQLQDREGSRRLIRLILPYLQFGLNQRIFAFTQLSANMLMFGEQLLEIPDIKGAITRLKDMPNDSTIKMDQTELEYVNRLCAQLKTLYKVFDKDHEKYVLISKKYYDSNKIDDSFDVSKHELVVYYVGDKTSELRKLRCKWSGPWKILERIRHNTLRICEPSNVENFFDAHVERLKRYKVREFWKFKTYESLLQSNSIEDIMPAESVDLQE